MTAWPGAKPWMRTHADVFLPGTCTIYTQTETSDGEQGSTTTQATRSSGISCRFATLSGQELVRAHQLAAEATIALTLPYGTAIAPSDRVVVTRSGDGGTYDLQVEYIPRGSMQVSLRVLCRELNAA